MLRFAVPRFLALAAAVFGVWLALFLVTGFASGAIDAGERFSIPLWIGVHLAQSWLNEPARLLGGGTPPATDVQLLEFFGETSKVAADETAAAYANASGANLSAADSDLTTDVAAANALNTRVGERMASELSSVIAREDLVTGFPGISSLRFVWPPVHFDFVLPPLLLIVSPRSRIELQQATLLRDDLSPGEIAAITSRAEADGSSALVVRVGGVATYPSIVEEDDTYADSLGLIAHEWTHQYLAFHPLGVRYFESQDMATINETVANMVGQELGAAMLSSFPLPGTPSRARASAPPPDRAVDFDRTMHDLRLQVDALLAQGNISAAEAQMNVTRQFLVEHGYYVPTINQAYFAFYGTYANTSASTSPIGPELATVRAHSASLRDFVHAVQDIRSVEDLQRLVTASGR